MRMIIITTKWIKTSLSKWRSIVPYLENVHDASLSGASAEQREHWQTSKLAVYCINDQ